MSMTGIYGAPLEMVKAWLVASSTFTSFSTDSTVHLYQRIGDGGEPAAGDAWGVLSYQEKQHVLTRGGAGEGIANWDAQRLVKLSLVKLVPASTNAEIESIMNSAGGIVEDIIDDDASAVMIGVRLLDVGVDESTDPIAIGIEIELELS